MIPINTNYVIVYVNLPLLRIKPLNNLLNKSKDNYEVVSHNMVIFSKKYDTGLSCVKYSSPTDQLFVSLIPNIIVCVYT